MNTNQPPRYLVTTVEFLYRNIRSALAFQTEIAADNGVKARKITDFVVSVAGAYLSDDVWVSEKSPLTDFGEAALNRRADDLQQRLNEAEEKNRALRLQVQHMADEFNLLAQEAVDIAENLQLSHAEKRGALKWWQQRVWKFNQRERYTDHSTDSEIPF